MSFNAAPSEAWSGANCSILSLVRGSAMAANAVRDDSSGAEFLIFRERRLPPTNPLGCGTVLGGRPPAYRCFNMTPSMWQRDHGSDGGPHFRVDLRKLRTSSCDLASEPHHYARSLD